MTLDRPRGYYRAAMSDTPPCPGRNRWWRLALLALVAWQGWLTLGLFGPEQPWRRLLSDEPILAGRHPLHLYHGFLGARALLDRGSLSCYDPAFHAGYPKTPVFDSGSRPAELALALNGGRFCPATYKVAQALLCLLAPIAVYLGARGLGLSRATGALAVALAQLVWWGRPGRDALEAGDSDLLLASLMAVAQLGLLVRYHDKPGAMNLCGLVLAGLVGWFAHPLLMVLLMPPCLLYYLSVGPKHPVLWHLPLFASLFAAVAGNAFWLSDLIGFWWVRVPPDLDTPLVTHATLAGVWRSDLWGDHFDRGLCFLLLVLGALGVIVLHRHGHRTGARLIGMSAAGLFVLAVVGLMYDVLGRLGVAQLIVPALLLACLPAACLFASGLDFLRRCGWYVPPLTVGAAVLLLYLFVPAPQRERAAQLVRPRPWPIGLGAERLAVVERVRQATTAEARILWEDRPAARLESRWTALLPVLTGRSFVGGLDAGAGIEHTATGLVEGKLAGQPLEDWSDSDLEVYCRRYNVKWIVTWSEQARRRLARWSPASARPLPRGMTLWELKREASFALTGHVEVRAADSRGILLADARPVREQGEEGTIDLSLHYQSGMRVSPSRVTIEKAETTHDNIPFVRLRMNGPVGRILITWEGR